MKPQSKLHQIKIKIKKISVILLMIGLVLTTYNLALGTIQAQQATQINAETRIRNLTLDDFNKPPYYSDKHVYAIPNHNLWVVTMYSNTSGQEINNLEIILPVPSAGATRAYVRPAGTAGGQGVTISYSNNNGATWDYTPSGEADANVTHIKYTQRTLGANAKNESIQAQFYAPPQASGLKTEYTTKATLRFNNRSESTNEVKFTNITKPEFNRLAPGEIENTLTGTTEIYQIPTPWTENTPVDINEEIGLRVYVRNVIPQTQAENLKIRLEFPTEYATTHIVKAYISADNADTLVDTTTFTTTSPAKIRYLKNSELPGRFSCKLSWKGQFQYKLCGDEIATTGYVWVDSPLKYGSEETLQLTVEAIVEGQPTPTQTPKPSKTPTPTPTPNQTATPKPTHSPTATPTSSQTPIIKPTPTPKPTPPPTFSPTPSPSPKPTHTPPPTPTITPTATPTPSPTPSMNINYNVTIEKKVDGTRVDGDKVGIQYRVKIKNNGNENINNFEVKDTLPPDFTYDQNTTEGDIKTNPEIQDVSGDDNRRLVWKVAILEKGKEINFGYRTTGKREDKNYCNDAQIEKNGSVIATSQACVRINQQAQVLSATTTQTLPSTGYAKNILLGLSMMITGYIGYRLSRYA